LGYGGSAGVGARHASISGAIGPASVSDSRYATWLDPHGRFIVDFTGGSARGTIRGRVSGHAARGTQSETSATATGTLCLGPGDVECAVALIGWSAGCLLVRNAVRQGN
jgi:hypothetical protein